jgi:hypothetical protein
LRALLAGGRGGWAAAQRVAWELLLDSIERWCLSPATRLLFEGTPTDRQHLEPDAPRFPTYILVAAALSFGVIHALVEEYDRAAEPLQPGELDAAGAVLLKHKRRAERAAHMAIEDVLDALGVTTVYCVCTHASVPC